MSTEYQRTIDGRDTGFAGSVSPLVDHRVLRTARDVTAERAVIVRPTESEARFRAALVGERLAYVASCALRGATGDVWDLVYVEVNAECERHFVRWPTCCEAACVKAT